MPSKKKHDLDMENATILINESNRSKIPIKEIVEIRQDPESFKTSSRMLKKKGNPGLCNHLIKWISIVIVSVASTFLFLIYIQFPHST